jgi:hypothetical protein
LTTDTPLERFIATTGRTLPSLVAARALTARRLDNRRALLGDLQLAEDVAVVMLGSWGRWEITSGSDDDYIVITDGASGTVVPGLGEVASRIAADPLGSNPPGTEGVFGAPLPVPMSELLGNIGLDADTNTNLTRRMLLMLESVSVTGEAVHAKARRDIVEGYLRDSIKDFRPPRFLLNDIVRYWRTIGVDFVAKDRKRGGDGWGLRNVKLRTSRKLLFISGLLPVLRCHEQRKEHMLDFLVEQFSLPPIDRLADAFLEYHAEADGVATLVSYDQFLQLLDDRPVRNELNRIHNSAEAAASSHFEAIARLGVTIDEAILSLLFGPALARWTRDFAIL